jgi:hypothetical protein
MYIIDNDNYASIHFNHIYLVPSIGGSFQEWFGFPLEDAEKHGIKHILDKGGYFSAVMGDQSDVSILE